MISYGIMQGRITPSKGRGIQFFPFDNWKEEFYIAEKIGLQEIEWIFDYDRYTDNPIWTAGGRKELAKTIHDTNVRVNSICFDYFMRRPFYKFNGGDRERIYSENLDITYRVVDALAEIGGRLIEIPMVDDSSLKTDDEKTLAAGYIEKTASYAEKMGIKVGLETDLAPVIFTDFLKGISPNYIYANFDSGNSSGIGYNPNEEIPALGCRIYNVHIKDRIYHGTTVALGTGSADFEGVFSNLKRIGYLNSFILQAARGDEGDEVNNIKKQLEFVRKYVDKFQIGV
jgi:hexulose-6-phosphate isomerase